MKKAARSVSEPGLGAVRPVVHRPTSRARRAPVRHLGHVIGRRGRWVFVDVDGAGVVALLKDGRVCANPLPWFGDDAARADLAQAVYGVPLAETEYRGVRLVETRLMRYTERDTPPPYDIAAVEAAAKAAASW